MRAINMNTTTRNRIGASFAGLLASIALLLPAGCEAGLGSKVDTEVPTITLTSPSFGASVRNTDTTGTSGLTFTGKATDDVGVTGVTLAWVADNDSTVKGSLKATLKDGVWTAFVAATLALPDGPYTFSATAADASGHTASLSKITIVIDNTAPTWSVTLTDIGNSDSPFNGLETIAGLCKDGAYGSGLASLVVTVAGVTILDSTATTLTNDQMLSWSKSIDFDGIIASGGGTDGFWLGKNSAKYEVVSYDSDGTTPAVIKALVEVTATDKAGNVSAALSSADQVWCYIDPAYDAPQFSSSSNFDAAATGATFRTTNSIKIVMTDDDAIAPATASCVLSTTTGGADIGGSLSSSKSTVKKYTFTYDFPSGITEGTYYLTFSVSDDASYKSGSAARTYTLSNYTIVINNGSKPTLTATTLSTIYSTSSVALSGTASASVGISSVKVAVDSGTAQTAAIDGSGNWTCTLTGLSDGNHSVVVTATDIGSQTTSLIADSGSWTTPSTSNTGAVSFLVDTTAPTLAATSDFPTWTSSVYFAVAGTASDAGSGLDSVLYSLNSTDGSNGTWAPLSGTSSWGSTITLTANTANTVWIRALDNAGHYSTAVSHTVKEDDDNPTISVTSPTSTLRVNGTQTVTSTVSVSDALSKVKSVKLVSVGSTTLSAGDYSVSMTSGDESSAVWNLILNASVLASATTGSEYEITAKVTDNADRTSSATFRVRMDKTAPTVAITSPSSTATTVNKTITVTGTAGDNEVLTSVTLAVEKSDGTWADLSSAEGTSAYNWSQSLVTSTYATSAYDSDSATAGYQLSLRATALDQAGNSSIATRTVTIDQHGDRPVIKLSQISTVGTDASAAYLMTSSLIGTIKDDDGTVSSIKVSPDGTTWSDASLDGSSWSYTYTSGDGTKNLYFKVVDAAGTTFTSSASDSLNAPYVYEKTGTTSVSTYVSFTIDTTNPTIGSDILVKKSDATTVAFENNVALGGASKTFSILVPATDSSGIASASVTLKISTSSSTTYSAVTGTSGVYTVGPFDVTSVADGSYTMTIKVTDNAGLTTTSSRSIFVDNTAPSITKYTYPIASTVSGTSVTAGDVVNGEITITGTAADNTSGSGLSSVKYQIGKNADLSASSTSWVSVDSTASIYNWEIAVAKIENYANTTYATDVDSNSIWELPIVFRIEDAAGNVAVTSLTDYIVLVNPDGDKPIASVAYPASTTSTMGGTLRLFGSAEDDDAVDSVYIEVDANGNGSFDAADIDSNSVNWYNSGVGRAVTGTGSWSQTINESGEFDSLGTVRFRVRAKDIYGTYGAWSSIYTITLDANVPQFSDLVLTNTSTGAVRAYEANMYISGSWILSGTVTDTSDIASILLSGTQTWLGGNSSTWFTKVSNGYSISIPVNTTDTGSMTFKITAKDDSDPQNTIIFPVTLKFDNTAPAFDTYTGSTPIVQSNNKYSLGGTITEEGSGLTRVAYYFERNNSVTTDSINYARIRAPLDSGSVTAANVDISTLTWKDSLPCLALTGATRATTMSLQHASLVGNANLRKGSLIMLNGVYHVIATVNATTGTLTWTDSEVATTVTSAWLAYAQVVDNTVEETAVWTSGGALSSITNDDGDLTEEYLTHSGGLYTWTASSNSLQIPDGPITLYCVAFDKAGNTTVYTVSTDVENNPPLLASVVLATDLNGDGDVVDTGETSSVYSLLDSSSNEQSSATAASSAFILKGKSTATISTVGGNGSTYYTLKAVCGSNSTASTVQSLAGFTSGSAITLTTANLTTLVDGSRNLVFTVWDSAEESTAGSNSLNAVLTVPVIVDYVDDVAPKVVISPFYWTSEDDNSLYNNSRTNGHIELSSVVGSTGPDVSGKVSIRGTTYDEHRMSAIYMRIDGNTMNGTTATYNSETYTLVATFSTSTNTWTTASTIPTGWTFTVTSTSLTQAGHSVSWKLDWDSSQISGVVGTSKYIKIVGVDAASLPSTFTTSGASGNETTYNVPLYMVDVVPYITGITRASYDTNRSKLGEYPIQMSETGITLSGFNLKYVSGTDYLYIANSETGTLSGTSVYDALTVTAAAGPATSLTFQANATHSGWLRLVESSIEATNGPNLDTLTSNKQADGVASTIAASSWNDDLYISLWETGAYFTGSTGTGYPSLASTSAGVLYGAWQDLLTSTCYNTVSGTAVVVAKTYDPADYSDIYWDNSSAATNTKPTIAWLGNHVGANPLYGIGNYDMNNSGGVFVYGENARELRGQASTSNSCYIYCAEGAADGEDTAEATNYGTQYGTKWQYPRPRVARYGSRLYVAYYDSFTKAVKYSTFTDGGLNKGTIPEGWMVLDGGYDSQDTSGSYTLGITATGLTVGTTASYNIRSDTYTLTSAALSTTNLTSAGLTSTSIIGKVLHMYDTSSYTNWVARYVSAYSGTTSSGMITWLEPSGASPLVTNLTSGSVGFALQSSTGMGGLGVVSSGSTQSTSAGEYVAIDVTPAGYPVVMYYDSENSTLRLTHVSAAAVPTTTAGWTRQTVFPSGDTYELNSGKYVAMKIDSSGNIHAVCRDGNDGKLLYLYAPAVAAGSDYTFKSTVVVDDSAAVGKLADITLNGSVPYISYLGPGVGTVEGIRYAKAVTFSSGIPTAFDHLVVPLSVSVLTGETRQRTNIEYNLGSATWGQIAIGYQGTAFDLVYLKPTE